MNTKMLKLFTLLLMTSIFFVACDKDEITDVMPPQTITTSSTSVNQLSNLTMDDEDSGQGDPTDIIGCYEVVPPLTFVYEDGTTVEVASEEDFEAVFTTEPYPVDVAFPINLEDVATGEVVSAANEEELTAYFEGCEWDEGSEYCDSLDVVGTLPCYDLDFPVSFLLTDGTSVTADTEADLDGIFQNGAEIVDFAYPVNLTNAETGETATAANAEELAAIFAECEYGEPGNDDGSIFCDDLGGLGDLPCYDFTYPLGFELADGTTVTADSEADLQDILIEGAEVVDFVYPVNLTNIETGEAVSAASANELGALFEECFGEWEPGGEFENGCFTFVFPMDIATDGTVTTVNNEQDLVEVFINAQSEPMPVYPFEVTIEATGEVATVNSEADLETILEDCEG